MTFGHILEYSSVLGSVVGAVYVARLDKRGYLIFIAAFFPAAGFAIYYKHWGLLGLYIYFLAVNCYGYLHWKKNGIKRAGR